MTTIIRGSATNASTPAISGSDADTGVFFPSADNVAITTGAVERLRIDSNGNVGIGTSSPGAKLNVAGDAIFNLASSVGDIQLTNRSTTTIDLHIRPNSGKNGFISFTEDMIADRWAVGIEAGNNALLFKSGSATSNTERMRIDSSGNVGIGTSSPVSRLEATTTGDTVITAHSNSFTTTGNGSGFGLYRSVAGRLSGYSWTIAAANVDGGAGGEYQLDAITFNTRSTTTSGSLSEMMRITPTGNVGIGTSSPGAKLNVIGDFITSRAGASILQTAIDSTNSINWQVGSDGGGIYVGTQTNHYLRFTTNNAERMRITSDGDVVVAKTATSFSTTGCALQANGEITATRNGNPIAVNRITTDGNLIDFYQDGTLEGTISISGNTVSYNAFAGSHWSQLSDGSKPEILRGTVMESINELCEWPDEPISERLCRVKISDTAGSKKVYGVFMCWDEDWTGTNDMLVTSLGAFICRINKDVVVQEGDLLESNGDGTARVQTDDIIRSSTIGKVTTTAKTHEYPDGSYCVPTVLYCG